MANLMNLFVGYFSDAILIRLPFGQLNVKHDGTKTRIGAVMRKQGNAEIVELYIKYLSDTAQMDLALSKPTLYKLLEVCSTSPRKSLTCVDYFIADAHEVCDEESSLGISTASDFSNSKCVLPRRSAENI